MVCPYCSFKNAPTAAVCNQCGIILRLGRTSQMVPQGSGSAGALSFVKSFLPGNRLKGQQAARQARLEELLTAAQERYDEALKDQAQAAGARVGLAGLALVNREIEKSLQWLQQAHQAGATGAEYANNGGVALARRGQMPQAAEMFEQAAKSDPKAIAPHANRAHLFVISGTEPESHGAISAVHEIEAALALEPQNPTLYNRWGLILCRERLYDQAREQFEKALALATTPTAQADAHTNIGYSHILAGERDAGRYSFDAALKLDPAHAHALSNLGLEQMFDGSLAGGLEKLQRAARLDPQSGALHANYGYGLCRIGAINDGILELKEAFSQETHLFEIQYNLGKSYADYGILDVADRNLARVLQIQPRSLEALIALGSVKARQGLLPQAIQCYQSVLRVSPANPQALMGLGICQALNGEYWEAGQNLHKAVAVDGHNAQLAAQLGWLNLLQDNQTAAEDELNIALELDDKIAEAQNNLGLCFSVGNKPELALSHFRRAIAINDALTTVHYQTGLAYAALKDNPNALKEWELTVRYEPSNPDSHVNRGVTFYKQGQLDDAVTEFRRVILLRQSRMEDFSNLALAYAKQGSLLRVASRNPQDPRMQQAKEKHRLAIDMFDRALVLDPNNAMLHSNRGLACFFAARAEEAMHEWTMVSKLNPEYARRRGKTQQSEYDDSQIALMPLSVPDRALVMPPKTMGYLPRYLPGYDTEEWYLLLSDPAVDEAARLRRESRQAERSLNAQ